MKFNPLPGALGENYWYDAEDDVLVTRETDADGEYVLHVTDCLTDVRRVGTDHPSVKRMLVETTPLREGDIWLIRVHEKDPLRVATVNLVGVLDGTWRFRFETYAMWYDPEEVYEKRFLTSDPNV